MRNKVKPSEKLSKVLNELISGEQSSEELLSDLMRLGAQKILQQACETEVDDFLGRGWYERGEQETQSRGYRNGYTPLSLKTSQGPIKLQRPRVRDTDEPFESQILSRIDRLEQGLIRLANEMYVRGLSTRDIEQTLIDEDGKAILSRTKTSQLTEQLNEEYERWKSKDLSEFDVVYLFLDAVYESVHRYTGGQSILCAWGICSDGRKVLLSLSAMSGESTDCWVDFLQDLKNRGLDHPLLIISDGGKGLISAIAQCFPYSERGRCIAHKMRNLMNKLPRDKAISDPIKARLQAIYYAPDPETAQGLAKAFISQYADQYPAMTKCFNDDFQACIIHLKYPQGHRRLIRTTNLIERSFVEQKRRTKIIPSHTGERSAMKLVFGTLIRAAQRWQRVGLDHADLMLLKTLRKSMCETQSVTLNENRISFKAAA